MPKGSIDRLNETLNQIAPLQTHYGSAFPAINANWLRESLFNVLSKDPYIDRDEVSEDISLGGGGWGYLKFGLSKTLRNLKRLVLLTHRILGYHSSAQTRAYKTSVQDLNDTGTLGELRLQVVRGIQLQKDSMQDWMIKTLVSDSGELRHYYNQGDDTRLNKVDFTQNGWCLGLSTQWLRFQATGKGDQFWTWMATMEGEAAVRFVMAAQGVRTHLEKDFENRAAFALKRFGLRKEASLVSEGTNATPLAMARNICAANHPPFSRIGQYYKTGGGHAMAASIQKEILFMDPNGGEVCLPSYGALESWLPKYVRRIGYDFTRHYIERYSHDPNLVRQDKPKQESLEDIMRNAMTQRRSGMGYDDED